jgi:hypothetical protein
MRSKQALLTSFLKEPDNSQSAAVLAALTRNQSMKGKAMRRTIRSIRSLILEAKDSRVLQNCRHSHATPLFTVAYGHVANIAACLAVTLKRKQRAQSAAPRNQRSTERPIDFLGDDFFRSGRSGRGLRNSEMHLLETALGAKYRDELPGDEEIEEIFKHARPNKRPALQDAFGRAKKS